jgi:rod shape-determining protein MreC
VHAAQFLHSLRAENERLRALLGLGQRLETTFIPADVLHQSLPTDGRTLLLSAGSNDGVRQFDVVVSAEGLLGVVERVEATQSIAMTWAHPEFRASAFAEPGDVFGVVAPAVQGAGTEHLLQLRGVAIRDSLAVGAQVMTSGLGGVFPSGIPVGTIIGPAPEETGWELAYLLQPAAFPGVAGQVLILHGGAPVSVRGAFTPGQVP